MRIPRFYQNQTLKLGECSLDEKATHHILHVLRLKLGAEIIVFNGDSNEYCGVLTKINKKSVTVILQQQYQVDRESPLELHLLPAVAKKEHMDIIIQKAVELGVTAITPIITDFCNLKYKATELQNKYMHWQQIIISATQQCGRTLLTKLYPIISFNEAIALTQTTTQFFLSPRASPAISKLATTKITTASLFIGSEGGFSEQEEQIAQQAALIMLQLGERVLRTETAAIAGITLLQHYYGDL